jgi:mono/diheme cytochrome c family protein
MKEDRAMHTRLGRIGLSFGVVVAGALGLGILGSAASETVPAAAVFAPAEAVAQQTPDGSRIYQTQCGACHQAGGTGVAGMFPPLTDTEFVTGDKTRLIRIILHGLTGPLEVRGEMYNSTMPPFGGALNNAEIAAVATYIRTNFGNSAEPVTAAEVARVRTATAARRTPWTVRELRQ